MNGTQHHIIRRNRVTVNAVTSDGFALQSTIMRIMNGDVVTRLSSLFDSMCKEDEWLVIDKLDVSIDTLTEEELERNFADVLLKQIQEKILERIKFAEPKEKNRLDGQMKDRLLNINDRTFEAFLYFVEKGTLPWWYEITSHPEFERSILNLFDSPDYASFDKYLRPTSKALQEEDAARRLVNQFGKEIVMMVLSFLMRQHSGLEPSSIQSAYEEITRIVNARRSKVSGKIWSRLDAWLIQKIAIPGGAPKGIIAEWFGEIIYRLYQDDPQYIIKSIRKSKILKQYLPIPLPVPDILGKGINLETSPLLSESNVGKELYEPGLNYQQQENSDSAENEAGMRVANAGLVILAPFLEQFFYSCHLLKEGSFTDKDKAMALLHYMVFGNLDYHEYNLSLPKVLCGVAETEPIEIVRKLSVKELDHAHDLLSAVIENWSALKGTSPDGLREGFLQRKGILNFKHDTWFLQVEQNTIDILLESLPWTISFIKLPWMKNFLRTQWT